MPEAFCRREALPVSCRQPGFLVRLRRQDRYAVRLHQRDHLDTVGLSHGGHILTAIIGILRQRLVEIGNAVEVLDLEAGRIAQIDRMRRVAEQRQALPLCFGSGGPEGFLRKACVSLDATSTARLESLHGADRLRPVNDPQGAGPAWLLAIQHRTAATHPSACDLSFRNIGLQTGNAVIGLAKVAHGRHTVFRVVQRKQTLVADRELRRRVDVSVDQTRHRDTARV